MRLSAPIFRLKRQAKLLSREARIPLNKALDRIAKKEGFDNWSLLAAIIATHNPASDLLDWIKSGDMVLLGARPGHGKTTLGLELLAEAVKTGQRGVFFTLEYTKSEALQRFQSAVGNPETFDANFEIDSSDKIDANHIISRLKPLQANTIAVIDYLQILDQRRDTPELSVQIAALKSFAKKTGTIFIFISQIDRAFDLSEKPLPDITDIRLPNPLDLNLFNKSCFLHNGELRLNIE